MTWGLSNKCVSHSRLLQRVLLSLMKTEQPVYLLTEVLPRLPDLFHGRPQSVRSMCRARGRHIDYWGSRKPFGRSNPTIEIGIWALICRHATP